MSGRRAVKFYQADVFTSTVFGGNPVAVVPEAAGLTDSLRIDIPKTDVRPMMRRRDGVKYLEMWNPAWQDMKPVQELINQVLSEGKKS